MIINTNVSSLTAQEASTNTGNSITSSLEKLSTGLKINKASDDASGLAIADKLRTQATSIDQGVANGNSAVSLLQIADKSMAEQSNILDTVKAKLIQANTDTTSEAGRESIRKDISKLLTQLDNIAAQTNYNGTTLLADVENGELTGKDASALNFQVGAGNGDIISTDVINSTTVGLGGGESVISTLSASTTESLKNLDNGTLTIGGGASEVVDVTASGNLGTITADGGAVTFTVDPSDTELISKLVDLTSGDLAQNTTFDNVFTLAADTNTVDLSGINFDSVQITTAAATNAITSDSDAFKVTNNSLTADLTISVEQTVSSGSSTTVTSTDSTDNLTVTAGTASQDINMTISGDLGVITAGTGPVVIEATNSTDMAALQKLIDDGAAMTRSGDEFTIAAAGVVDMSDIELTDAKLTSTTAAIGDKAFESSSSTSITMVNNSNDSYTLTNVDASSAENLETLKDLGENGLTQAVAADFQDVVDDAITQLNGYRGDIGSTQNQVESAVRNLMTQSTNVQAAESIIRDVDYAQESANFNKQNIISQAGSYAISQANSVQQNVLRLLQ